MPPLAIAALALLSLAVAVLLLRELRRDDDGGPRRSRRNDEPRRAPVEAPPVPLDPRVRQARTSQLEELRRVFLQAGYRLTFDDGSSAAHTFVLEKMPCVGTVVLLPMSSEADARRVASQTADTARGATLLVEGRTFFTVALMRADAGQGPDPGCTGAVAALLAR